MEPNDNVRDIPTTLNDLFKDFKMTEKAGGSGGDGSGITERVIRIESDVDHIKNDLVDIKTDLKGLRKEMHEGFTTSNNNIITVMIALVAVVFAVMAYFKG